MHLLSAAHTHTSCTWWPPHTSVLLPLSWYLHCLHQHRPQRDHSVSAMLWVLPRHCRVLVRLSQVIHFQGHHCPPHTYKHTQTRQLHKQGWRTAATQPLQIALTRIREHNAYGSDREWEERRPTRNITHRRKDTPCNAMPRSHNANHKAASKPHTRRRNRTAAQRATVYIDTNPCHLHCHSIIHATQHTAQGKHTRQRQHPVHTRQSMSHR